MTYVVIAGMSPTIFIWVIARLVLFLLRRWSLCGLSTTHESDVVFADFDESELTDMSRHGSTMPRRTGSLNYSSEQPTFHSMEEELPGERYLNATDEELSEPSCFRRLWWRFGFTADEKRLLWVSPALAIVLYVCLYLWFVSLPRTSVSNNLAVENSQSIFVFLFSVVLLRERIRVLHIMAVLVCGTGVLVILFASPNEEGEGPIHETLGGYVAVLLSTVFNSLYQVLYAKWMAHPTPEQEEAQRAAKISSTPDTPFVERTLQTFAELGLFLGLLGFFTLTCLWPAVLLGHLAGLEPFVMPTTEQWEWMIISGTSNIFFYLSMAAGTQLTSALWISVGSLASVPASMLTDYFLHNYIIHGWSWLGVALVVAGFILMNIQEYLKQRSL